MNNLETRRHSFVVRVWQEEGGAKPWRGSITHVMSGDQRYFSDLVQVIRFIRRYLQNTMSPKGRDEPGA